MGAHGSHMGEHGPHVNWKFLKNFFELSVQWV
jgi:hypothetical protein